MIVAQAQLDAGRRDAAKQHPPDALPPSFGDGRFQVKKLLGQGTRQKVYLAHDTVLDREVALSVIETEGLDPDAGKRVLRAIQGLGKLGTHPTIVAVCDLGSRGSEQYVVMEPPEGGDPAEALAAVPGDRLPVARVLEVGTAISRALAHAHSKGVIHGDLEPSSIRLTSEGRVRIGDLDLALTPESVSAGTAAYRSPEQAAGPRRRRS